MCIHCEIDDYVGENFPIDTIVNGTKQHYEAYLLDDIENDQKSLVINGTFSELRMKVSYCPNCGKKL